VITLLCAVRHLQVFLHILCRAVCQVPSRPGSIFLDSVGARAISIQWTFNNENWGGSTDSRGFTITVTPIISGSTAFTFLVDDENARSYVAGGLRPFSYDSSMSVEHRMEIVARTALGSSPPLSSTIRLPRKSGGRDKEEILLFAPQM
jgi:hypothetical protein